MELATKLIIEEILTDGTNLKNWICQHYKKNWYYQRSNSVGNG